MDNLKKILEVLNDLIRINKDREAGYNKISRELTPAEHNLRSAFERKAMESRNNIAQLEIVAEDIQHQLTEANLPADSASSFGGRIYKMWEEVKDFFTGSDKPTVLRYCADREAKATSCYENALNEVPFPESIYSLLNDQKASIDASQREMIEILKKEEAGK